MQRPEWWWFKPLADVLVSVSSDWLSVIVHLIVPPASQILASVQISIGELIWHQFEGSVLLLAL